MGSNKKVLSKAVSELGKAKAPAKPRDITVDPAGQWKYPGQETRIPGNDITMQGVPYPVWAQPNVGPGSMMQPNQDYNFPGASYVDETPMVKKGGTLQSKKYSKSMSATNKLFTKNKLFQNKKSKIFDPNAEFKTGGSKLGTINLNPNPLSHYELNYGFNLPTEENGGESDYEDLELTDEEIQAYRDGGYVVEELPKQEIGGYVQHELVKAQGGKTVYSGPNRGLVGPSTPKTNGAPTIANAKILEAERQKAIKQKGLDALAKKIVVPKRKIPANMMEAEQMIERGELYNESISEIKAREKKEADAREAQRVKSLSDYEKRYNNPNYNSFTGLPGESYRDNLAKEAESLDAKFRVSQKDNFFDDYINPAVWIGSMAKNLGEAPKKAKETNSYMPYITSVAAPLTAGALAGLGSPTTKQFVNKIINPIAGMKFPKLPKRVPSTPTTGGGNLNAGFSPELIKNFVGPKNKVLANIVDKAYISPFFSKTINKYNPLNLSGIGEKLEGAVSPLSNVLGNSIKNNKLIGSKSLFGKAKPLSTQVGKTDASQIYAARFNPAAEGSNIRLGEANPQGRFSRKSNATFPIKTKAGVDRYDVPISDPGVELFRKYPFMNRYAPINKQKLMNNQFQWSTTGAGLQNIAEKYGRNTLIGGLGYGAYNAYNYDKNNPNTYATPEEIKLANKYNNGQFAESDIPSRTEMFKKGAKESYESPLEYVKDFDPYFIKTINNAAAPYTGLPTILEEKQKGGNVESWEDELDDEEIRLLEKGGYIVERL